MRPAERSVASRNHGGVGGSPTVRVVVLGVALCFLGSVTAPRSAHAQTPAEIQTARETFMAALKDEQAGNFNDALPKYRQVQKVKDTPQVRYRIATCLAGSGKLREAKKTFAEISAQPGNQEEKDVETAAKEQVVALTAKTPAVTVHLRTQPPAGATVQIDGQPAVAEQPQDVDPGAHVIVLTGPGLKRGEVQVTTAEGVKQVVELAVEVDAPPPPPSDKPSNRKTYGFIGVGVGGALAIGTIVALVVRNGDTDAIKKDCPGDICPTSTRTDVNSAKSNANTAAVAAGIMGAGAVIAGGFGAYLLLTPDKPESAAIGFAPQDGGGIFQLRGQF